MADDMDRHQERLEALTERAVAHARSNVPPLTGESICRACGLANDRAPAGYAVCSDCVGGGA